MPKKATSKTLLLGLGSENYQRYLEARSTSVLTLDAPNLEFQWGSV